MIPNPSPSQHPSALDSSRWLSSGLSMDPVLTGPCFASGAIAARLPGSLRSPPLSLFRSTAVANPAGRTASAAPGRSWSRGRSQVRELLSLTLPELPPIRRTASGSRRSPWTATGSTFPSHGRRQIRPNGPRSTFSTSANSSIRHGGGFTAKPSGRRTAKRSSSFPATICRTGRKKFHGDLA